MTTFIVGAVCLVVGFIAGGLVYRKNASKVAAVVTAVSSPPKA